MLANRKLRCSLNIQWKLFRFTVVSLPRRYDGYQASCIQIVSPDLWAAPIGHRIARELPTWESPTRTKIAFCSLCVLGTKLVDWASRTSSLYHCDTYPPLYKTFFQVDAGFIVKSWYSIKFCSPSLPCRTRTTASNVLASVWKTTCVLSKALG